MASKADCVLALNGESCMLQLTRSRVQFNRHLKFKPWVKAWVKDEVKDAFRKALDREMVKAWVKAVQNVY